MKRMKTFKTKHQTELPLLNLKGKDYLEVKYRLVWFREEHPDWSIETEFTATSDRMALARAIIRDESGRVIATSHKMENAGHFPDFLEKAETGAIGRALALIGYGTQFCADELDEGERIVDSPAQPVHKHRPPNGKGFEEAEPQVLNATSVGLTSSAFDLGEYRINFGKKYYGKRLKEVGHEELQSYIDWLMEQAESKGKAPSHGLTLLKSAVDRYLNPEKFENTQDQAALSNSAHGA
jgi:hypothetical protein